MEVQYMIIMSLRLSENKWQGILAQPFGKKNKLDTRYTKINTKQKRNVNVKKKNGNHRNKTFLYNLDVGKVF